MSKKEAKLKTSPVSWSGGKILMFQSSMSYVVDKDRTVTILGDPARTEKDALANIGKELGIWNDAVAAFNSCIEKI